MPAGELHLGVAAAERVRREIRRARGNEVCFILRVSEEGELVEPRAVARGHASAVLPAVRDPEPGGVLLHNHPSGTLEPSEADLEVAARLWELGLGFAITNNEATDLYVVVEPPTPGELEPLDTRVIDELLGPGGPIARAHPGYEDRPQQRALSRLVADLYNEGGVGIAEAGTGTGKSVAYLLPAILWALQNKERTIVSTNTINLQEQLVEKDLPFLQRALGQPFTYTLVKGRNNYVSIRRARLAWETAPSLLESSRHAELKAILEWVDATRDGSLSDLSFRPSPEVWEEVASDSDVCLRAKCPHFEACFYQRARRGAASADILVANHHLLFSDLAVRRAQGNYTAPAVLPHYRRLVLDEAHNLEEAATRHLGAAVSRRSLFRLLSRIENRGRGVLPAVERALREFRQDLLVQGSLDCIEQRLRPELLLAREKAGRVFEHLEGVMRGAREPVLRLEVGFARHTAWANGLGEDLEALLSALTGLSRGVELLRERIGVAEETRRALEQQMVELRGLASRLESAMLALRTTLLPGPDASSMVRWIEARRETRSEAEDAIQNIVLSSAPLDLAETLRESLIEKVPTVVLTSATLATRNEFRFLRGRLGLLESVEVREAIHASPFDFDRQALIVVPDDLPVPGAEDDRRHAAATVAVTLELAEITDGGLFVLFTSYRALREASAGLRRRGAPRRWPLFVHGEAPRAQLVSGFIASGRGILLGTTSFWEGVDVPGRPLRGLVIPKLPFKVPSEPVTAARIESIEARGGNSFVEYMLPHAAIRLKQGFGRLIRSRADRGATVILDSRVVRKSYGRYLLESLPPAPLVSGSWRETRPVLEAFYADRDNARDPGLPLTAARG